MNISQEYFLNYPDLHIYIFYGIIIFMHSLEIKNIAISLRKHGKTYAEINSALGKKIPKATLSFWLSNIPLKRIQRERIKSLHDISLAKARIAAQEIGREKFRLRQDGLRQSKKSAARLLANQDVSKMILASHFIKSDIAKHRLGIYFASASENYIKLILHLMRFCYNIDEDKFRCTILIKQSANLNDALDYWSKITKIPRSKFYKPQIDCRPKGKTANSARSHGVCRVTYLSNELLWEIDSLRDIYCKGL